MKKFFTFTLLRYIDIGLFSLIVLAMANNVGPSEYGSFAYAFILITYSAYIVFGTNQSIVKHFPLSKKEDEKNYFFKHGIYVTGLGLIAFPSLCFES